MQLFRAFTPYVVWQVVFSHPFEIHHFYSIVGFRPIVLDRELLSDIWRRGSQSNIHLLLHCTIRSFPVGTRALGTMTSADFSRQALLHDSHKKWIITSVRPPRIRALSFHLMPTSFTPTVPNSYRALVCSATLPTVICLIWSLYSLGQTFAASFLQISPHNEHPCSWLCNSRY